MSRKLDPEMIAVLAAGAIGLSLAIASGAALWLGANALGVSYEVDGAEAVGLRAVITSLVVVALAATATALVVRGAGKAVPIFIAVCALALVISLVTPATVAADSSTATVLIAHHVLGGALIAAPLIRSLRYRQQHPLQLEL